MSMNAYSKHKKLCNDYIRYYSGGKSLEEVGPNVLGFTNVYCLSILLPIFSRFSSVTRNLSFSCVSVDFETRGLNHTVCSIRSKDRTDLDVIREEMQFVWEEDEDVTKNSWEKRLAKRYYDKLFKEYCICDLMYYKENKVAMRWRVEREVIAGKGQFSCGAKRCEARDGLRSWEVNFAYVEKAERKNALVKLRKYWRVCALCPV
jgi:hypothetical protein